MELVTDMYYVSLFYTDSVSELYGQIILYICILSHIAISLPLFFAVFCAAY
jgi:hypothetical protein